MQHCITIIFLEKAPMTSLAPIANMNNNIRVLNIKTCQKEEVLNFLLIITFTLVCYVRLGLIVPLENCSLIWRRHHYWRRAANLSSEVSLSYHTYCDSRHRFKMVISEDPWHTPFAERLAVELSLPAFRTVAAGIRTSNFRLRVQCSQTHCASAAVYIHY